MDQAVEIAKPERGPRALPDWVPRRTLDVEEYTWMCRIGIIPQEDRTELIEGEIVRMPSIGSRHAGATDFLVQKLVTSLAGRALVRASHPLNLADRSLPQPDIALVTTRADFYRHAHPAAEDVLLLIEVAQTSERSDREIKRPLYARHAIPEYWIVDLAARVVDVCRDPSDDGYRTMTQAIAGETLEPIRLPGLILAVADILG